LTTPITEGRGKRFSIGTGSTAERLRQEKHVE
jgi:hypothetical protein